VKEGRLELHHHLLHASERVSGSIRGTLHLIFRSEPLNVLNLTGVPRSSPPAIAGKMANICGPVPASRAQKSDMPGLERKHGVRIEPVWNRLKTVSPGGMKTDFFTRSFDVGRHPAYDALGAKPERFGS
jgi:hypothetical protein